MAKEIQIKVKNVFRCGADTLKREYTEKWIELINLLEKNQGNSKAS